MIERWGPRLALVVTVVTLAMGVAALLMKEQLVLADLSGIPFFAFGLTGAFVAARQPRNSIGWLFMIVGAIPVLGFFSSVYATRAIVLDPGSLPFAEVPAWISSWAWIPGVGTLLTFCLLLYPDGHLPSRRWRFLAYGAAAALAGAVAGVALMPGKMEPFEEGGPRVENPFAIEGAGPILEPVAGACLATLLFFAALSVGSLGFRFRAAGPQQRQQLKWFLYAAGLLIVLVLFEGPVASLIGETASSFLFSLAILLLPVATGIGILRYRLFDIDLVINRTLVYASLTAILAGVYLTIVVLLQQLLSGVAAESDLAIAGSTLAVAGLFRPLRARVQLFIDRRFYRSKYDAGETLERFSSRLRDQVELHALTRELIGVIGTTVQPAHASLWLREDRADAASGASQ